MVVTVNLFVTIKSAEAGARDAYLVGTVQLSFTVLRHLNRNRECHYQTHSWEMICFGASVLSIMIRLSVCALLLEPFGLDFLARLILWFTQAQNSFKNLWRKVKKFKFMCVRYVGIGRGGTCDLQIFVSDV